MIDNHYLSCVGYVSYLSYCELLSLALVVAILGECCDTVIANLNVKNFKNWCRKRAQID